MDPRLVGSEMFRQMGAREGGAASRWAAFWGSDG